jgi:hypothetical protein
LRRAGSTSCGASSKEEVWCVQVVAALNENPLAVIEEAAEGNPEFETHFVEQAIRKSEREREREREREGREKERASEREREREREERERERARAREIARERERERERESLLTCFTWRRTWLSKSATMPYIYMHICMYVCIYVRSDVG